MILPKEYVMFEYKRRGERSNGNELKSCKTEWTKSNESSLAREDKDEDIENIIDSVVAGEKILVMP